MWWRPFFPSLFSFCHSDCLKFFFFLSSLLCPLFPLFFLSSLSSSDVLRSVGDKLLVV